VQNLHRYDAVEPARRDLMNTLSAEMLAAPVDEGDFNIAAQTRTLTGAIDAQVTALLALVKRLATARQHAAGFASAYAETRVLLDTIGDWKSSAQLLVDVYESLMLDAYEAEGVASMRLENGASVSTTQEPYGKVVDKEAFRVWCIANGYEQSLQLWPASMNAIVKERTLAGEAPPAGVEVFAKTLVRLNKA
jgi:hypothetical protein